MSVEKKVNEAADDSANVVQRKLSLLATFKAIAWSFFGIRKGKDYESDAAKLNPVHVVIVGLFCALIFVLSLIFLVKLAIRSVT